MSDLTIGGKSGLRKIITVNLVGTEYKVRVPKAAILLAFAKVAGKNDPQTIARVFDDFITSLFSRKDAASVRKRLADNDDDLDIEHLGNLIEAIAEYTSENPTG